MTQYRLKDIADYKQNTNLLNKFLGANGTNTSSTATPASIAFVSTTAKQVSTTSDAVLYIACTTSTALTVAMGATSGASDVTLVSAATVTVGLISVRVPMGWYVKLTGTMADFTCNYVTC